MPYIKFKQKCSKCRKNYVIVTRRNDRYAVCYDCQKDKMQGEIKDPKMKKMFTIPDEFYKQSTFLRDIKIKYLQFGNLTENQVNAFIKVVDKMKEESKKSDKEKE